VPETAKEVTKAAPTAAATGLILLDIIEKPPQSDRKVWAQ
jgi:hypothetical protein